MGEVFVICDPAQSCNKSSRCGFYADEDRERKSCLSATSYRGEFHKAVEIDENAAIPEGTFDVPGGVRVIYNEYESGMARANTLNQFQLYKTGLDEPLRIKAAPPKHGITPEELEAPSKDTGATKDPGGKADTKKGG